MWHLNELARIDRHRILHVVGATQDTIDISVGKRDDEGNFNMLPLGQLQPERGMNISYAPFKDGAQIARFTLSPSNPDPEMEMNCEFSFVVTFAQDVGIPFLHGITGTLGNILAHIQTEVVPPFVDSFGGTTYR